MHLRGNTLQTPSEESRAVAAARGAGAAGGMQEQPSPDATARRGNDECSQARSWSGFELEENRIPSETGLCSSGSSN